MAKSVNKALLLGYVGKAPEIRSTAGGTLAASFSLATTERQEDRQGNWTDKTEWHNLVAYGRTAEIVRDYVNKGTHLFAQGKIQTRSWDDKESGQKKYRSEIVVFDLTLLGDSRRENGRTDHRSGHSESGRRPGNSVHRDQELDAQFCEESLDPSEIPF
jgi:single-strand DNA-binding protein